jgi:hypothetical protein
MLAGFAATERNRDGVRWTPRSSTACARNTASPPRRRARSRSSRKSSRWCLPAPTGGPSPTRALRLSRRASAARRSERPDWAGLDVALVGVPMDLGVTNRPGARLGPRAVRRSSASAPIITCTRSRR